MPDIIITLKYVVRFREKCTCFIRSGINLVNGRFSSCVVFYNYNEENAARSNRMAIFEI